MSKKKKSAKIKRPKGAADVPEAQMYDLETFEPKNVDKRKALKAWFNSAKEKKSEDGLSNVLIDPKQAVYAKKEKKK